MCHVHGAIEMLSRDSTMGISERSRSVHGLPNPIEATCITPPCRIFKQPSLAREHVQSLCIEYRGREILLNARYVGSFHYSEPGSDQV